jgi:hypothetical protein
MAHKIDAKTPRGAANQLLRAIRKIDPEEQNSGRRVEDFRIRMGDHSLWWGERWSIVTVWWEGGPYEWAIIASGGGDIFAEEFGDPRDVWRNGPTFDMTSENWYTEPENSYSLTFVKL